MRVRALHTPGHTLDHTSYVIDGEDGPGLLFSGGSLLAGSAGRTDLAGAAFTDRLTAHQFTSVRRLAALDAATVLHPTHGAGSFCTASGALGGGFSTVGRERATNPALMDGDLPAFRERQLAGLLRYPAYYPFMAPINRAGPRPLGTPVAPATLTPAALASLRDAGIAAVDGRPRAAFAAGHIPGSLNVELVDDFATYVGWLLPFDAPIALVLDPEQDATEAVRQLAPSASTRSGASCPGSAPGPPRSGPSRGSRGPASRTCAPRCRRASRHACWMCVSRTSGAAARSLGPSPGSWRTSRMWSCGCPTAVLRGSCVPAASGHRSRRASSPRPAARWWPWTVAACRTRSAAERRPAAPTCGARISRAGRQRQAPPARPPTPGRARPHRPESAHRTRPR